MGKLLIPECDGVFYHTTQFGYSRSLLVEFFESSITMTISSTSNDDLTSSFPIHILVQLLWLIIQELYWTGVVIDPDSRGKAFSCFPFTMTLALWFDRNGVYQIEMKTSYFNILQGFCHEQMLNFVKCFLCID